MIGLDILPGLLFSNIKSEFTDDDNKYWDERWTVKKHFMNKKNVSCLKIFPVTEETQNLDYWTIPKE